MEISTLESLWNASKPWFPKLKPIHTRWTSTISVPQVYQKNGCDKERHLWCLRKRLPISQSCLIGDSFKFFHFPGAVRQKLRWQRWKGSCHGSASFVYKKDSYVYKNKQEEKRDLGIHLPRPFWLSSKAALKPHIHEHPLVWTELLPKIPHNHRWIGIYLKMIYKRRVPDKSVEWYSNE